MIRTRLLRFISVFTLVTIIFGCPTNDTLRQLCKCESSINGITLDCSSSEASDPIDSSWILLILRENRAQLGLIQELTLRNGTLKRLPSRDSNKHPFEGLYVKKLDLSNNELENISSDAFHGLESVLQILILSKNQIRRFPAPALSNMVALLQLDLSDNAIEDLQEIDSLRNTPKLFDLNLANNRICNVHKQAFDDLKQSMQTLNLGGNCFDRVPASAVRGFKRLLALHLHDNQIAQLEPLQFMNLPSLNLINLSKNRIEIVHRQAFLNVPNLRFMYLSDNNITRLEANEFRTFENLELLDLTRNRIRLVPRSAFVSMPRLSQLYLAENGIQTIEADAFTNSSLLILLLADNELTQLRADMFNGLTNLQQFSLKGNKISRISSNAFYQLPSLVVIDLSENQIASLEPATFLAQLNLFLLDLSRNKLAATPYNAFNRRIVTVVLQDNPLVCTEHVHVLQNGVGVNVPGTVDNVCIGGTGTTKSAPLTNGTPTLVTEDTPTLTVTDVPAFVQELVTESFSIQYRTPAENFNVGSISFRRHTSGPNFNTNPSPIVPSGAARNQLLKNQFPAFGNSNQPAASPDFAISPQLSGESQPLPNAGFGGPDGGSLGTPRIDPSPNTFNIDRHDLPVPAVLPGPRPEASPFPAIAPSNVGPLIPIQNPHETSISIFNAPFTAVPIISSSTHGSVPGFVEQVPLDENHENRGGNSNQQSADTFSEESSIQPDFAWTWPPPGPSPQRPQATQSPLVEAVFPLTLSSGSPPRSSPNRSPTYSTLPPDLATAVISTWTNPPPNPPLQKVTNSVTRRPVRPWQTTNSPIPFFPSEYRTTPAKKRRLEDEIGGSDAAIAGTDLETPAASTGNATTTIAVCLTVVVVVMISVFITLCIVRHRSHSRESVSSASRTSAYVAAQTARLNYATSTYGVAAPCGPSSGTGAYIRDVNQGTLSRGGSTAANSQWIYAPGTYASPSAYYK